jgi:hypothetical protein
LELLDWQSFPFTFSGVFSAIDWLQKDLSFYADERKQYCKQRLKLHKSDLEFLRQQDSGRVFYDRDTEGVRSICDVSRSAYSTEYSLLLDQAIAREENGIRDCFREIEGDTFLESAKATLGDTVKCCVSDLNIPLGIPPLSMLPALL